MRCVSYPFGFVFHYGSSMPYFLKHKLHIFCLLGRDAILAGPGR